MRSVVDSASRDPAIDARWETAPFESAVGPVRARADHLAAPEPRPWLMTAAFGGVCAVAFILRFCLLASHGAPPTTDSGNWLAYGHALLGEHLRPSSVAYPPVVPLLVAGATAVFGTTVGVSLVSAAAALAPGIGAFVALRWLGCRWASVTLAGLLVFVASTGEAAAWGGFPQLVGLGLLVPFLVALDRWLLSGNPRHALIAGVLLMGVVASSDIVTGVAAISGAVVVLLRTTLCRPQTNRPARQWMIGLAMLVIPCAPFAPLYLHLGSAVVHSAGARPASAGFPLKALPSRVEFTYRDFKLFWRFALMVAFVTPLFLIDRRRRSVWVVTTALLVSSLSAAIVFREDRYLYVLPTAVVMALGAWFEELERHRTRLLHRISTGLGVVLAAALLVQIPTSAQLFRQQRRYYAILDPGLAAAVNWLHASTPRGSIVAVPPVRNAPTGWWVEGMGHRLTLIGSPLQWLTYPNERRRATLANAIFSQSFPDSATMSLARRDGVSYLLLPESSDVLNAASIAAYDRQHPASVVFHDQTAVVLRVSPT
jgi:hypothetical protein